MAAPLTCSCDAIGCCETPVSHKCDTHDDGTDFSDIAAARREGVIEGLVIALQILDADHPGESQRIAAEIERLRGEA